MAEIEFQVVAKVYADGTRAVDGLDLTIDAATMFIAGEPMKPATNWFAGRSYNRSGSSTCCR